MNYIEELKLPIYTQMQQFEKLYSQELDTDNKLLKDIHLFLLQVSGKKLRPIITLLCAEMIKKSNQSTLYGAFAIELLHTATLVHDDVIDYTMQRRGQPSINAKWTNKAAVLFGDYMLSKSLYSAGKTENIEILKAIARIGMTLTDGELLQLAKSEPLEITEEVYFDIVDKKTAKLFSICTEIGGLSAGASETELEHLRKFGEYLGTCFQIKDDIFDYDSHSDIGKPTANDVKDGKVTLPLIYALKHSTKEKREKIVNYIQNKDFSDKNIEEIILFAIENGGLDYAIKIMEEYYQKAVKELDFFADNEAKKRLKLCLDFVVKRKY